MHASRDNSKNRTYIRGGGGKSVTDGTVVWRVKDSRCPYSLGQFVCKLGEPKPYEYLLLCDGSTISADDYPELCAVLGGTQLPNLIGRVLQGDYVGGAYKAPGLPNIWGSSKAFHAQPNGQASGWDGCVYTGLIAGASANNGSSSILTIIQINAQMANRIYGASATVQPAAYTTKIYICYGG